MNTFQKYLVLFSMVAMTTVLSSCFRFVKHVEPSENIITKEYDLKEFVGIDVNRRIILHYRVGEQYSIKAQGPENMMEELICKVGPEKILILEVYKGERFSVSNDSEKVHVWVTAPNVSNLTATVDAVIESGPILGEENLGIQTFNGSKFVCDSIRAQNVSLCVHNASMATIGFCQAEVLTASAFNAAKIKVTGEIENMMTIETHNASKVSFYGRAATVNAEAYNAAFIKLEGEFQNKSVSHYNGARISIEDKHIDLPNLSWDNGQGDDVDEEDLDIVINMK